MPPSAHSPRPSRCSGRATQPGRARLLPSQNHTERPAPPCGSAGASPSHAADFWVLKPPHANRFAKGVPPFLRISPFNFLTICVHPLHLR